MRIINFTSPKQKDFVKKFIDEGKMYFGENAICFINTYKNEAVISVNSGSYIISMKSITEGLTASMLIISDHSTSIFDDDEIFGFLNRVAQANITSNSSNVHTKITKDNFEDFNTEFLRLKSIYTTCYQSNIFSNGNNSGTVQTVTVNDKVALSILIQNLEDLVREYNFNLPSEDYNVQEILDAIPNTHKVLNYENGTVLINIPYYLAFFIGKTPSKTLNEVYCIPDGVSCKNFKKDECLINYNNAGNPFKNDNEIKGNGFYILKDEGRIEFDQYKNNNYYEDLSRLRLFPKMVLLTVADQEIVVIEESNSRYPQELRLLNKSSMEILPYNSALSGVFTVAETIEYINSYSPVGGLKYN